MSTFGLPHRWKVDCLLRKTSTFQTPESRPGTHAGVLIVRLPDSEQWRIGDHLVGWLSDPDARAWGGCFIVATIHKVRVLRPA